MRSSAAPAAAMLEAAHRAMYMPSGSRSTSCTFTTCSPLSWSDLKDVLQQRGSLPIAETVTYALQVCDCPSRGSLARNHAS